MSPLRDYDVPPLSSWEDFEDLCLDLWRRIWNDPNAHKNGRSGQEQCGVDVYGRPNEGPDYRGVQCKKKDTRGRRAKLTVKEVREEVQSAYDFDPGLRHLTIATTDTKPDTTVQKLCREITEEHEKEGLFSVDVWYWDEILDKVDEFDEIKEKFFPWIAESTVGSRNLTGLEDRLSEQGQASEDRILSEIRQLTSRIPGTGSDASADSFTQELDYARGLIDQHNPQLALEYLEDVREKIEEQGGDDARRRFLSEQGTASLRLGRFEEAGELFVQAMDVSEPDEKTRLNGALGHHLLGDSRAARDLLIEVIAYVTYNKVFKMV